MEDCRPVGSSSTYAEFLESKRAQVESVGFDVPNEEIHPDLFPFQRDIVRWALRRGRAAIWAGTGLGKALASNTKIICPDRTISIGELKPGDFVIGVDGKPTQVLGVFPQGVRSGFRVTFSDDASVICDDEHLWAVRTKGQKCRGKDWQIKTLREIREEGIGGPNDARYGRWFIPMVDPVQFQEIELPIHPYVLGCLLGDGGLKSGQPLVTSADPELINRLNEFLPNGIGCYKRRYTKYDYAIGLTGDRSGKQGGHHSNPIKDILVELGVWGHGAESKFIPECYKFANVDTRVWLIQGLLDTDGGVWDSHGSSVIEYCTVSKQLAEDFLFLVQSIGGRGRIRTKKTNGRLAYRITPAFPNEISPFLLSRKADIFKKRTKYFPSRSIRSIEPVGDVNMTCIKVAAENGLFITEGFIVTHNTAMQLEWSKHVFDKTEKSVLVLAPLAVSHQTVKEGEKWGIPVQYCADGSQVPPSDEPTICITNYQRLDKFDPAQFGGIVLDESSILKGFGGSTRKAITEFCSTLPYRLACTATPAPNDLIELTNHAEFLGVMSGKEIIALFFTQDGNSSHAWRLKGHARKDFWTWLAKWAVALRTPSDLGYSDDGYILPALNMLSVEVEIEEALSGNLFAVEALTLQERQAARRESTDERVKSCADLVNTSDETWIVWCDLNRESEALAKAIPGAIQITGSDSDEHKERAMLDFSAGKIRVLISKPSICGFGMNWQHCHNVAFVGLSDSFERMYQAIRRCWRFGQTQPVDCHVITAQTEGAVLRNIERKEKQATDMIDQLVAEMRNTTLDELGVEQSQRDEMTYQGADTTGDGWKMMLGDCIERMDDIPDESIGLSVFSPPFPGMYVYTNSARDLGNCADNTEMIAQFRFLIPKLLRVTKPGRTCAVHLTQSIAFKGVDGYIGLKDFRGQVIQAFEEAGWIFYGEVCIDKDPQVKAIRTKDRGLLFKTLANDSAHMHMALADYLLQFRKPGDNQDPIRAGISKKYGNPDGWITQEEWIEWAAPVWYRKTEHYPGGISENEVLNVRQARETDDERHLCPLQLGVIERAVKLWSNPGDTVLSPFAGIGSEGYVSLKLNRKFIGIELKESYYRSACQNLKTAEAFRSTSTLLSLVDIAEEAEE